jgi:hypothetical protein
VGRTGSEGNIEEGRWSIPEAEPLMIRPQKRVDPRRRPVAPLAESAFHVTSEFDDPLTLTARFWRLSEELLFGLPPPI